MTVHKFDTTGDAYDSCQIGIHLDNGKPVNDGDVMIIEEEGVVGVAWTWPIAATKAHGQLHVLDRGVVISEVEWITPDVIEGYEKACKVAAFMGFELL
jgi:hypothetical protein